MVTIPTPIKNATSNQNNIFGIQITTQKYIKYLFHHDFLGVGIQLKLTINCINTVYALWPLFINLIISWIVFVSIKNQHTNKWQKSMLLFRQAKWEHHILWIRRSGLRGPIQLARAADYYVLLSNPLQSFGILCNPL